MKRETEMFFAAIVHEDRSVLDLLDSDYTFLNEQLAKLYGIPDVKGDRDAAGDAAQGQPARRPADAGDRAGRHVEPDADLAGEARPVHSRQHPGHARRRRRRRTSRRWRIRRRRSRTTSRPCARSWRSIGASRSATPATRGWTRSAWRSRTSTRWACGARRNATSRSTPRASSSPASRSTTSAT